MREKLTALIVQYGCEEYGGNSKCDGDCFERCQNCTTGICVGDLAKSLAENGVVVREKGEWVMKETMIRSPYAKNAYCPFCLEETSYAHNFCPNCGADMRKGENG